MISGPPLFYTNAAPDEMSGAASFVAFKQNQTDVTVDFVQKAICNISVYMLYF